MESVRKTFEAPGPDAVPVNRKVKVLYVAGWGRSGSTVLGRIFGQMEGFSSVGELRYIWDRGINENRLCGCGAPFAECRVWQRRVSRAFKGGLRPKAGELAYLRDRGLRTRHLLLKANERGLRARTARMGEYTGALEKLYKAVEETSQSRVIVDTSKFPSYGYMLQAVPGIELYVLHLVRDPRAVAFSWASRRKPKLDCKEGPSKSMTPHSLVESSLVWDEWNFVIENTWGHDPGRYMRLRYEDFVESPRDAVQGILRFLGEAQTELPFVGEREVPMGVSHTFSGNPDRFRSGSVIIESDEVWKRDMSVARQALVTALTLPGLARYGYPIRPQREGSSQLGGATRSSRSHTLSRP